MRSGCPSPGPGRLLALKSSGLRQGAALTQPRLQQALRALSPAPAHSYASLAAPPEGAARAELRAHPARRLHARVRRCGGEISWLGGQALRREACEALDYGLRVAESDQVPAFDMHDHHQTAAVKLADQHKPLFGN